MDPEAQTVSGFFIKNEIASVKPNIPITIIGAGAVGTSIAHALYDAGIKTYAIYSLQGTSANTIARKYRITKAGGIKEATIGNGLVIIAVPDDQIPLLVDEIKKKSKFLTNYIFLHTSGALTSNELAVLKRKGASTGSFHPLQTFPSKKISRFRRTWIAIEGDTKAIIAGKHLAKILDANAFMISKKAKVLYHSSAVFASNYLVTLLSVVEQIGESIHIPRKDLWKIYRPIIEQTIQNVLSTSPEKALTGPIVRGDKRTVLKHIQALSIKKLKHLVPLYSILAIETARLAQKKYKILTK